MNIIKSMKKALAAMLVTACAVVALATDVYVDAKDGDDSHGGTGGWNDAVKTLARALTIKDGQSGKPTVWLAPGTYPISETITVGADGHLFFHLRSKSGNPADTIVDAEGKCAIYCEKGWASGNVISGITFRNGFRDGNVYTSADAVPPSAGLYFRGTTVTNCIVENCLSTVYGTGGAAGAGIHTYENHAYEMTPTIIDTIVRNCVISNYVATDTSCGSAKGAGMALRGAVVNNCVISNNWIYYDCPKFTNYNNMSADCGHGAGIWDAYTTWPTHVSDSIICGNVATNMCTVGYGGRGGGAYLSSVSTISNCLIACNSASCTAGGLFGGKLITHCTISNNIVATKQAQYYNYTCGGGACVSGTMRGCHVIGNTIVTSNSRTGGGGVNLTGAARVLDCVIEDNVSPHGGAFSAVSNGGDGAKDAMVSNCLIRCNNGTVEAGIVSYQTPDNVVFADCEIVNNKAAYYLMCYGRSPSAACRGLIFRNCFIHSNTNSNEAIFGGQADAYTQPIVAEYCTIADNRSANYVMRGIDASCATNFYLRGCVLYNNKNTNNKNNLSIFKNFAESGYDYTTKTNAMYVFADVWGNMNQDVSCHNRGALTLADFNFKDAANSDYRPTRQSCFLDTGDTTPSWMSASRMCQDMGDGTMTVSIVAGMYGVTVTRNNPSRRLNGDGPDAGCFQLPRPCGLVVIFR